MYYVMEKKTVQTQVDFTAVSGLIKIVLCLCARARPRERERRYYYIIIIHTSYFQRTVVVYYIA